MEDVFVVNLTKEEEQSENIIEEPVVCQKDALSKKTCCEFLQKSWGREMMFWEMY